ncbi:hypothetical protein G6F61_006561 [Rhizopus arrhizus]|nr:hypothetical protein G6F61_006561 [Rhizopus arrhizus]
MEKLQQNIQSSTNDDSSFMTLTQFDTELQQQAQFAIQQEIDAWQEFENYLPQLDYQTINQRSNNNNQFQLLSTQNGSDSLKLYPPQNWSGIKTTQTMAFVSPTNDPVISPFSSPSSVLEPLGSPGQQVSSNDPSSTATTANTTMNNTPLESPIQSPTNKLFSFDFSFLSEQQSGNTTNNNNNNNSDKVDLSFYDQEKSFDSINTSPPIVPQQKKRAHNVIERRYRNNINERITELKNAVPALVHAKVKDTATVKSGTKRGRKNADEDEEEDGEEYVDGVAVATKLNKATILRKATEYIMHLRRKGEALHHENDILQRLVRQLPGGQDVLNRYLTQKSLREKEMHQNYLFERNLQKQMQQQRRKSTAGRKKSRVSKHEAAKPLVPAAPSVTNRVFMAAFMAISFFSTSPLFTGPTTREQFESHHHISRTADNMYSNNSSTKHTFIASLFPTNDGWSMLRTTLFVICIFQLFLPLLKSMILNGIKVKSVNKKARTKSSLSGNIGTHFTSLTPGDQKCMQIYSILAKSLENEPNNKAVLYKNHTISFYLALSKEIARFVSRHWLGFEILYDDDNALAPQEQWVQACKWIKLNEVECLGGNPELTRASMLFSCFRVLNLIDVMDDDENEYVEQSRSRVYATAALQMALIIPHHGIAETLSRYFWRLSMYESGLEDDPLMNALTYDCHEDDGEDRVEVMIKSRAWYETLEVMSHQIHHFDSRACGLSLSMNAPVLVPVGILSTLHLLDNLQTQFGRLIISVTTPAPSDGIDQEYYYYSEFSETVFAQILDITTPQEASEQVDDYHSLAHWLASVGAIVEALWKSDIKTVNALIKTVLKDIPLSLVSRKMMDEEDINTVRHKERQSQLDQLTKKSMTHTLIGAALLKTNDLQQGIEELCKAEKIKVSIRSLSGRLDGNQIAKHDEEVDLESSVMALADFVTAVTGLEAWITAWRLVPSSVTKDRDSWEERFIRQVRDSSLQLRRMIGRHSLDGLRTNDAIVERLTRLGSYVSREEYADSACDCSSEDEEDSEELGKNTIHVRRPDRALDILHGLA